MGLQEKFLDIRGRKIQVLRDGSGPRLLYLHSAGGEVAWLPFFEQLAQHFTVWLPAHPGFAQSEGLDRIETIEDLVFHYVDVLDALDLEQPMVVGLSLGAWLAAELAVHHPRRVRKLVLINPVGLKVDTAPVADPFAAFPAELRHMLFHDPESEVARTFIPDEPTPEQLEATIKAREATARVAWNPFFYDPKLRDRLYRIKVPTLILWGESDRLVSIDMGTAYHEGIAGSQLVTLKACGHAPPFERPSEAASIITEFLSR